MIEHQIVMDEEIFKKHRLRIRESNGFAQNADALLRQVLETMAREPVCTFCTFVTPADSSIHKVLLPLLNEKRWTVQPEYLFLEIDGSPPVPYNLINVWSPRKKTIRY